MSTPEPVVTHAQDPAQHGDAGLLDAAAEPKPWWQSRALIGAAIVVLAQAARLLDIEVDTQATTDAVTSAITLIGAAMAWWGRVRATQPVRFRRPRAAGVAGGAADTDSNQRLHAAPHALPDHAAADPEQPDRGAADIGRSTWLDD